MWATDRAPGLHRGHWGFSGWAQHDETIWQEVKAEAQTRARKGLAEYSLISTVPTAMRASLSGRAATPVAPVSASLSPLK